MQLGRVWPQSERRLLVLHSVVKSPQPLPGESQIVVNFSVLRVQCQRMSEVLDSFHESAALRCNQPEQMPRIGKIRLPRNRLAAHLLRLRGLARLQMLEGG